LVWFLVDVPRDGGLRGRELTLRFAAPGLLLLGGLAACDPSPDPKAWEGSVRDSAGVVLVHNTARGQWSEDAWAVEEILSIGSDDAPPATEFGYVADVANDHDTLYVLDQSAQEVRVFDDGGVLLRTIGGPGDGPGEISRFAASLVLTGDTLIIADWGRGRLHRFLSDGTFLDAVIPPGEGARSWWRLGADGGLYARSLTRIADDARGWVGDDRLYRFGGDWSAPDTVLRFEYTETDIGAPGEPRFPMVVNAPSWDILADGRVVWSTLEEQSVRISRPDGSLERIVTSDSWSARAPSLDEEMTLRSLASEKMVMLGGDRSAVDQLPVTQPDLLPVVTVARAGPDGTVWLQRLGEVSDVHPMMVNSPDPPSGWGGGEWDVLDADGRYLGSVGLGARVRIARIDDERIVGIRRDELDREEVVVWRLVR